MKVKINRLRRRLMRSLTARIGRSSAKNNNTSVPFKAKRILINRPNQRLGNLLLITPLIQELELMFPDCKIDLFVKGKLAPILFKNYRSVDKIIELPKKPFSNVMAYLLVWVKLRKEKYDLVINVDANSSSGRLSTSFAIADHKFFNDQLDSLTPTEINGHFAKRPVHQLRNYLLEQGIKVNTDDVKPLDLRLTNSEIINGKKLLDDIVKNNKPTIVIFTYATVKKCFSKTWWKEFYKTLKDDFQEKYNIVEVLPVENISQIDFQAPSFYSVDVRELGSFISQTSLFIGADGGVMHLASAVGTPTIGLFSVTRVKVYEPYNKRSMGIDTTTADNDYILKQIDKTLHSGSSE